MIPVNSITYSFPVTAFRLYVSASVDEFYRGGPGLHSRGSPLIIEVEDGVLGRNTLTESYRLSHIDFGRAISTARWRIASCRLGPVLRSLLTGHRYPGTATSTSCEPCRCWWWSSGTGSPPPLILTRRTT